jgi:hypothetical protein
MEEQKSSGAKVVVIAIGIIAGTMLLPIIIVFCVVGAIVNNSQAISEYFCQDINENISECESATGGIAGITSQSLTDWIVWVEDAKHWNSLTDGLNLGIDIDGAYGAQCVDISKSWLQVALKLKSPPLLTAVDSSGKAVAWGSTPPNGVNKQPMEANIKAGDIIFFTFGHTAVAINDEDDNGNFTVIEQNKPSPRQTVYNKAKVLAFYEVEGEKDETKD